MAEEVDIAEVWCEVFDEAVVGPEGSFWLPGQDDIAGRIYRDDTLDIFNMPAAGTWVVEWEGQRLAIQVIKIS